MNNVITDNAAMVAAIQQAGFIIDRAGGITNAYIRTPVKNGIGETLWVEINFCTVPGGAKSLPAFWSKRDLTPTRLASYWYIYIHITAKAPEHSDVGYEKYNPMLIPSDNPCRLFTWILEATPENLYKLLSEAKRRFLTCEK
jgi:hypothetical protein